MKNGIIKNSILELIDLKYKTNELIDTIYHNSDDVKICIYSENPITIFLESPRGFELLASLFKKRIITSSERLKGIYTIKKYFCYKDVEFFCLYKDEKKRKFRMEKTIKIVANTLSILKTIGTFILGLLKFLIK
jgi:hypothetical protein